MAPSEKIIADREHIGEFIPQKPPMVMIDTLVSAENGKTITTLSIRKDNLLFHEGFFKEPGLIENIAQTAAAGVGYLSRTEQKPPPVGFIGGIRNLKIHKLPEEGDTIRTEVIVTHEVFEATVVEGKVFLKDELIAEGELKIFIMRNGVTA